MAVSNSTDFNETAVEIIEDALAELGVHADEEPLQPADLQRGLRALNRLFKAWQADGVMVWTLTEGTLTLAQGDYDYAFGSGGAFTTVPFDIAECRIVRSGSSLPMLRLSRDEYYALPRRDIQGYPTQFYYDRQRSGGTLYVWPAPDALGGELEFTYQRIIMDVDDGANDFDLPQEWHDAIVLNLAKRLLGPYSMDGTATAARIAAEAEKAYLVVKGSNLGEGMASVRIAPAGYGRGD